MIEQQLYEYLYDIDAIRARVANRIYPGRALQGTTGETIILQEITDLPTYTIDLEAGISDMTVQIDCYAASPKRAFTLKELVRAALSGFQGTIGTTDRVWIESCRIIGGGQEEEIPQDASDRWIHRYRIDMAMFVRTTIPTF